MITFGDIINKPKIDIFSDSRSDKFYNNCKTRESDIKKAIEMSFRSFNDHVRRLDINRNTLTKWEKEKVRSCLNNLTGYMEYLITELDKNKIEQYCKYSNSIGDKFIPFLPDIILLMINSFQGAIETDLHWVTDLKIGDSFDISVGDFNFNKLEEYLPSRIKEIQKICGELKDIEYVSSRLDSIKETILCHETRNKKASNLLLLTIIEGLVRSLGVYLAKKQVLEIDPTNKRKYASLDSFLKNIPWKKDLQISEIKYGLLTGNYLSYKLAETECISVNLTERLGFLCRRFKENRNVILHGEETQYDNTLNSFLNFSALKEVLLTIKGYQSIYN